MLLSRTLKNQRIEVTEQSETSKFILEKNLEVIKNLEDFNKEVDIVEVNSKQRLYSKFTDNLYIVFEVRDNGCSLLAVNSEGDEINLDDPDIVINEDDLTQVQNKIKDYFINFCSDIKTKELNGEIIASEDEKRLKALQVIMSTQKYDLKDTLELINGYIKNLNLILDENGRFGINNKALTGATGFIPSLINSGVSTRIEDSNSEANIHKLINELVLMEGIPDTLKSITLSALRDRYKNEYKSFFESNEYNGLSFESRVLPVLILGRDINSKEMYNECVTRLSDILAKTKEEKKPIGKIADNYISIAFDMLNRGNKLNMQIGPMLNPLRPLINCIEEPNDFFTYCDCISKNIPDFNTSELDSKLVNSGEVIDIYAKTNMITELNSSNKLNEIFIKTDDQKKLIESFLKSFENDIINPKLNGGFFLAEFKEAIDILYELNPEIFIECYKNIIEENIKDTPIHQSFVEKYRKYLVNLSTDELIQETAKIDTNDLLFSGDKYTYICEEFFKKPQKELNNKNISNLSTEMLLKGYNNDLIWNFSKKTEEHKFLTSDIFKSTIENISSRENIDPSKKKELANKLCNEFKNCKNQEIENTKNIFKKTRLKREIKNIEKIKNNISSSTSNTIDINTKKSVLSKIEESSNEQQFRQEFRKTSNNEENILKDNKTITRGL